MRDLNVAKHDWIQLCRELDGEGVAVVPGMLDRVQCESLRALYAMPRHFRSRVVMQRHAYGSGEYQYFADPLPPLVQRLRETVYPQLVPIADDWVRRLYGQPAFPATHAAYRARCHARGQCKPTPLLLRYRAADYNRLHQDLYGELSFPLQLIVQLNQPGTDFDGGELVLTEQRPRMQSRARVIVLNQGDAAVIAVAQRPVAGPRGDHRVQLRHGVSTVHRGERHTLGVIFHDAR